MNLNFYTKVVITKNNNNDELEHPMYMHLYPIMSCVAKGKIDMLEVMLMNKTIDIDCIEPLNHVNSFWLAALYGHCWIMKMLAEKGADIYITNK